VNALAIVLHVLSAVVWVGGMAFAYVVLRPAAGALDAAARLRLWRDVFASFLPIVMACVLLLLASGYVLIFDWFGGFATTPVYVHIMHGTGWIMILIFLHLFFAPWRRFRRAVDGGDHQAAAAQLGQIRRMVAINLALGVLTVIVATGRYWI
jgi:uncharacterized membrane protein